MDRGIPQQMLREMALRDMNRPSVMFHGLANESTGLDERRDSLSALHEIDRAIDGTRLTGQATYGWQETDETSSGLDVAGYTLYYGVFYGDDPIADTDAALQVAHRIHPDKPIVVLEFGRWADTPRQAAEQRDLFEATYGAISRYPSTQSDGFVSAVTWWSLRDFATQAPRISIERFGLFDSRGSPRPVADAIADAYSRPPTRAERGAADEGIVRATPAADFDWRLIGLVGYAAAVSIACLALTVAGLFLSGGRALGRVRR
jgi:beta-glucuronidase